MDFDWTIVTTFLMGLKPWVSYIFIGLGAAVVLGMGIDKVIPDDMDKGFMSKVLAVPVLGGFLKFITRFSPFNVKEENKSK